jgi:hypothetical protein
MTTILRVTLRECAGKIALQTPLGTLVFTSIAASNLGYAMQECARWSVAKESGDPDRQRHSTFLLYDIDPAPVPEQGSSAPPDMKGQLAIEPDPVSSGGGIDAGSGAGGGA